MRQKERKTKRDVFISSMIMFLYIIYGNMMSKVLFGNYTSYCTNIIFDLKLQSELPQLQNLHVGICFVYTPPSYLSFSPPSWVLSYSIMIFTPLVKNKLASFLTLPQSGRSTGNHQCGEKKSARKVYFSRAVIDGGEKTRGSEGRPPEGKRGLPR